MAKLGRFYITYEQVKKESIRDILRTMDIKEAYDRPESQAAEYIAESELFEEAGQVERFLDAPFYTVSEEKTDEWSFRKPK